MIEPSIRSFTASDGYKISFRHWQSQTPRGIIVALHGIQSHSGWYKASSRAMAEANFDVYFADRRGSGRNGLQRGHAAHGMRLMNDVRALAALARDEHQASPTDGTSLPVVIMGISWGGKTAAATVALFPQEFSGLALLYPGLEPRRRPNARQRLQLKLARWFEITRTDIPIPLRAPELFTDAPQWRQFIAEDPLALHTVTSSLLNAGKDLDEIVTAHGKSIQCPVLLMLAGRDAIIDNPKTRERVATFGTNHLTSICYPNACHTLEFEPDRETIFSDLTKWLGQHFSCRTSVGTPFS
ncbi:MAG: alpha/beta fold hydrolase [Planctomycetota bacterium]|nr:alpha/beta fold hydrolase [Planctomycetota bacterium]